jgi:hypothetical protein
MTRNAFVLGPIFEGLSGWADNCLILSRSGPFMRTAGRSHERSGDMNADLRQRLDALRARAADIRGYL